jgi:hypothetical protein
MKILRAETKVLSPPIPRPCPLVRSITITTLQYYRLPRATMSPTRKQTRDESGTTLLGSLALVPLALLHNSVIGSSVEVSLLYRPTPWNEARYELAVPAVWNAEALPELTFFQGELEEELDNVEGGDEHESPASRE